MKKSRNYYQILHVQPDAPHKVIQSSYRTIMQHLNAHPDRGGDVTEAALINRAYAVLSNPAKRADYDRELSQKNKPASRPAKPAAKPTAKRYGSPFCPFCANPHQFENDVPTDAFCATCHSPLSLADHERLEPSGQRKITRIGKRTTLSFCTQWPQAKPHVGMTENISKHGMMFESSLQASTGSMLKINCSRFQTIARVENCRQAGSVLRRRWHIGVSFITLHFKKSRGVFVSNVV